MRSAGVVLSLLCATMSRGATEESAQKPADEEQELANLVAILSHETDVATKTRMNSDFVPGTVTVLQGDELEAMGIETAWEALSLVPGMQAVRDRGGLPSVMVRGLPFPFNSGNVRVLVNGLSLANEHAGINGISLQIPIQLVERIEVIRGPGSVVYGDFAFMGLVNIVTRAEGARLYARGGGDKAVSLGASLAISDPAYGFSLAATGAGWASTDAPAAAPRAAHESRGWGSLNLGYRGFSFTAEAVGRDIEQTNTV
ncbi:MAG: TonB-dependent receptor plug domain-containing protein, partial [Thermoanaerobaculia bacterium]